MDAALSLRLCFLYLNKKEPDNIKKWNTCETGKDNILTFRITNFTGKDVMNLRLIWQADAFAFSGLLF